jgi:hypothetical protein
MRPQTGSGQVRNATGLSGGGIAGDKRPSGYKVAQLQQYTPEQMQVSNDIYNDIGPESYLSRLSHGDQSYFDEIEAPAKQQFNQLQGNIASRFSMGGGGQGAIGGRNSSAFQNSISQASSDFAQQLQANRQNLMRQATQDLRGLRNDLLSTQPYERYFQDKGPSTHDKWMELGGNVLGGIASGAGKAAGAAAGGF